MAEENLLSYLQRPLPPQGDRSGWNTIKITDCKGLSRRSLIDSAFLEDCLNLDVGKLPVIMPLKVWSVQDDFRLMWKENEGAGQIRGPLPIGRFPSAAAFGRYLAVGSYLSPDDILSPQGWDSWSEAMDELTRQSEVMFDGPGMAYRVKVGGAHPYTGGAELEPWNSESWRQWYCHVLVDIQTGKAYMALPPTTLNDVAIGDSRFSRNGEEYFRLREYMGSDEELGERRLTPFQLYVQDEEYSMGRYETRLLTVNARQLEQYLDVSRAVLRQALLGLDQETGFDDKNGYMGSSAVRNVVTPITDPGDGSLEQALTGENRWGELLDTADLTQGWGDLFHATSTVVDEEAIEANEFVGFLAKKNKPFGAYASRRCGGFGHGVNNEAYWPIPFDPNADGNNYTGMVNENSGLSADAGEIETIESVSAYVEGAVPAAAAVMIGSRMYDLYGSGVYVSAWNNYADFTSKFGSDMEAGDAWSSLSAGNTAGLGDFVAIYPYNNRAVCFKTNCSMEVRGAQAPFTLVTTSTVGAVGEGAVCDHGGYLLFAGEENVYLYTGSEPEPIGDELCLSHVSGAAVGAMESYLFCSLEREDKKENFVCCLDNGYWGRFSAPAQVRQYLNAQDGLYILGGGERPALGKMMQAWPEEWFLETKYFSGSTMESLMLQSLNMILDMDAGSTLKVSIRYYTDGDYTLIWQRKTKRPIEKEKVVFNFDGKKCGGFQLRLEGSGYSCVYVMDIVEKVVAR